MNKSRLLERIAETVREKIIEGIADLRDESDRDGVRVVIELKRDAMAEVVLNQLLPAHPAADQLRRQHAGDQWRPAGAAQRRIVTFLAFREEVITKRTVFELKKTRERPISW